MFKPIAHSYHRRSYLQTFLHSLKKRNQSAWLYKEYKKNINDNAMEILEQVAMLTPENIHLNSFMFEPILDMSLLHLYDLYQEVKNLLIKNAVITP